VRAPAAALFRGLANVLAVALIIYLTYFFTAFFSAGRPEPAAVPESVRAAAKKTEERLAEERKLLSTYGPVNPATGTLRIPIDRATELLLAENASRAASAVKDVSPKSEQPAAAATTGSLPVGPKPETLAAAPQPEAVAPPVAASEPARAGMAPAQLYRAICIACHDGDGRGTIVRKAMPAIPDFTDAKWQASRTDAELQHTMLEGKGQLMLPMKDKFALARTDVKDMVAFVRGFRPGTAAAAAASQPQPAAPEPGSTAVASSVPAGPAPAAGVPAAAPTPSAGSSSAALALALAGPAPELPPGLVPPPPPAVVAPAAAALTPRRIAAANPVSPAKLRAAGELYRINCLACHGPDGRGSVVRAAMPPIPDFTNREWQASRAAPQLSVSILEGKGALMPAWHGKIGPDQARDLVAYVRAFGPADLVTADAPTSAFGSHFGDLSKQWAELDQQIRSLLGP
jgi:mono/diheme cytochrome c family protein